jgi:hypothetical protein
MVAIARVVMVAFLKLEAELVIVVSLRVWLLLALSCGPVASPAASAALR